MKDQKGRRTNDVQTKDFEEMAYSYERIARPAGLELSSTSLSLEGSVRAVN